jgi:hypothetical protein
MLTPEQLAAFIKEAPDIFLAIAGGWGRMGVTHSKLAAATEDVLAGALHTAWKLRKKKNDRTPHKTSARREGARGAKPGPRPREWKVRLLTEVWN